MPGTNMPPAAVEESLSSRHSYLKDLLLALGLFLSGLVLTRVFVINVYTGGVESLRISFASLPVLLGGIWLGPWWGGIMGGGLDLAGFALQGSGPYVPMITLVSGLRGVLPGLLVRYMGGNRQLRELAVQVAVPQVICTVILMPLVLYQAFGIPVVENVATRLQAQALTIPLYIAVTYIIVRQWSSLEGLRESEQRGRRQRAAIDRLVQEEPMGAGETPEAMKRITRIVSEAILVERASIWMLSQDRQEVRCLSLYEASKGSHSRGKVLKTVLFPKYFEALGRESRIYAHDARDDPRTRELADSYLVPLGITSMLDAGIVMEGTLAGIICLEHTGSKRRWHPDEEAFVSTVASMVAQVFTNLERRRAEEALLASEKRLKAAFENTHDAITILDREGKVIDCNQRALELYGLTHKGDLLGKEAADFSPPTQPNGLDSRKLSYVNIKEALAKEDFIRFEWLHQRGDASRFLVEVNLTSYSLGDETVLQANLVDITERKSYVEKLQYLSMHDALTGLYNRAYFNEEMKRLSGSREYPVTIISVDLDGLKLINDTMGHARGDQLIQNCGMILKKTLRNSDVLARLGGDEFAILLPRTDNSTGEKIVGRIRNRVDLYNLEHPELPLNISAGIATAEKETDSLKETYIKADNLMYRNKLENRDQIKEHTVDMFLASLEDRDYIAEGHGQRIAELCMKVGVKLGLTQGQLSNLILLALVHDLGKVAVPDDILFKKETLTEDEWDIMRQHGEKGYHIAKVSPETEGIAHLILTHHEHWDGGGYSQGLSGEEIPLECRIFAIAEAFEVMTNPRPYREARGAGEALAELKRGSGTRYDPKLLEVFLEVQAGDAPREG